MSLPTQATRVRLRVGGRNWWTVQGRDDRYVILTRQAPFRPKGQSQYTILDFKRGVRGPCNRIGQGWDFDGRDHRVAARELLDALNGRDEFPVEISHRNNVPIDVEETQ